MKIVTISVVRNEADIIETLVRFHAPWVDRMLMIDHASADATPAILERLRQEGLPVEITRSDAAGFVQGAMTTEAMQHAARDADWIVPLDADEFLHAPGGDVHSVLQRCSEDAVVRFPWRTYVPRAADDAAEANVLKRIRHRRCLEEPQYFKIAIPGKIARSKRAVVEQGAHQLKRWARGDRGRFPVRTEEGLRLAHFPVRSGPQMMTKALVGWLSMLAKPDRGPTETYHWKGLYDRFVESQTVDARELSELALRYASTDEAVWKRQTLVEDPVPLPDGGFELRYTAGEPGALVPILARQAEGFATALAELRRNGGGGKLFRRRKS